MFFSPETADFCIRDKEEEEEEKDADHISDQDEKEAFDIESAKKPFTPIPYRGFLDVMDTMNIKFGYNDGKLSAALDLISLYLHP